MLCCAGTCSSHWRNLKHTQRKWWKNNNNIWGTDLFLSLPLYSSIFIVWLQIHKNCALCWLINGFERWRQCTICTEIIPPRYEREKITTTTTTTQKKKNPMTNRGRTYEKKKKKKEKIIHLNTRLLFFIFVANTFHLDFVSFDFIKVVLCSILLWLSRCFVCAFCFVSISFLLLASSYTHRTQSYAPTYWLIGWIEKVDEVAYTQWYTTRPHRDIHTHIEWVHRRMRKKEWNLPGIHDLKLKMISTGLLFNWINNVWSGLTPIRFFVLFFRLFPILFTSMILTLPTYSPDNSRVDGYANAHIINAKIQWNYFASRNSNERKNIHTRRSSNNKTFTTCRWSTSASS